MKRTHPAIHAIMALTVAWAFFIENWYAAGGWACAWLSFVSFDHLMAKMNMTMKTLELFVKAHRGKWPSKEAEDAAVKELQEFVNGGGK